MHKLPLYLLLFSAFLCNMGMAQTTSVDTTGTPIFDIIELPEPNLDMDYLYMEDEGEFMYSFKIEHSDQYYSLFKKSKHKNLPIIDFLQYNLFGTKDCKYCLIVCSKSNIYVIDKQAEGFTIDYEHSHDECHKSKCKLDWVWTVVKKPSSK
jgi:hypothetical protein